MIISSIVKRLYNSIDSYKNIVWTTCDDSLFNNFIKKACDPCSLINFDNTYYGFNDIDLIICNNRIIYLDKCIELAYYLHCPLLIVDHLPKSSMINNSHNIEYAFEPIHQIAVSKQICDSWGGIHDRIMDYNIDNLKSLETWKNLVFQLSILNFKIKTIEIKDDLTKQKESVAYQIR
jgi:hypothetical protein